MDLCAIRFIDTNEHAFVIGGTPMSAKWRRSKRYHKWLEPEKGNSVEKSLKILPIQKPIKSTETCKKASFPRKLAKKNLKEPQPLIDLFQEENCIIVVAEIAGFNKETLKIDVKDQKLTLSAKAKDRRYYKSLNLPKEVIPTNFHTSYKNGVLEIRLKRVHEQTIKKQVG